MKLRKIHLFILGALLFISGLSAYIFIKSQEFIIKEADTQRFITYLCDQDLLNISLSRGTMFGLNPGMHLSQDNGQLICFYPTSPLDSRRERCLDSGIIINEQFIIEYSQNILRLLRRSQVFRWSTTSKTKSSKLSSLGTHFSCYGKLGQDLHIICICTQGIFVMLSFALLVFL